MTKAKAIKILQEYSDHLERSFIRWNENPFEYTDPTLKDINQTLGKILERDYLLIKAVLKELQPSTKKRKVKNSIPKKN
ncbi:MAG: hypothetical protein DWQ18_03930 [Crenarchaeota archaeon]|nr:MAG: hypothetical protein DWQ17_09200 [Thermoproteota archaeon]RDJ34058.1 MAG: hypothetical protein DWQ18_03930 [Thermoproteota archaeon]RDJ36827.1 MAG: hypothetical protein DWQ13_06685 [Thermoproteota archaeon]RDJ37638.1 MAG: hypothetical protein DWQ19_04150 [Thermoproteota archaeon]